MTTPPAAFWARLSGRGLQAVLVSSLVGLVAIAVDSTVAGQAQPAGQGRGRGQAPAPVAAQAGHPSGKLVIWGDLASFDPPDLPATHCVLTNRFKRGQRVGFRMTAIDGGTGEVENTAILVAHLAYAGRTIDVPMRWRGVGGAPPAEYRRQPVEMWTGMWTVPSDATTGTISYTVTATDRFGRTATFAPFINLVSQLTIVE